jgi:F420 biosynthesis protein FbiB-like protein
LTILNLFKSRRSIHEYSPKKIPEDVLLRVFEAARWAPSAHNAQPWRFIVIRDPAVKRKLARAMADRWDEDLTKNGVTRENREILTKNSIKQFTGAPVVVVACLTMENMDEYPDKRRQKIEHVMAIQSVAAAIENMLLAAHSEGIGSCWFCAPLFCQGTVRKVLGIPRDVWPQALITMGYPAKEPIPPPRKPFEKIVFQNRWRETS